jgi:hypothetical protein
MEHDCPIFCEREVRKTPTASCSRRPGATRICFIDRDLVFAGKGKVVSWDVFAGRAGEQRLMVRPRPTARCKQGWRADPSVYFFTRAEE